MKSIGESLFQLGRSGAPAPTAIFRRAYAKGLGLQEGWFRDAIFAEPELVIGPCRSAGRVDAEEVWLPWRKEINLGHGPVDVLLVSSRGRIGIVETKLSYNPQRRREVVAQILDYALALQDREDLPELPDSPDAPSEDDLADCLAAGRLLLLIAGDALDSRALRLSNSMLAKHLTVEWDLAMIDLNVYCPSHDAETLIIVPELLGVVQADPRQVVRVIVEGTSKTRVVVGRVVDDEERPVRAANIVSLDEFLSQVERQVPQHVALAKGIADEMRNMASRSGGNLAFQLRASSANLYYNSSSGPRRFLSLRTDGRLRLVLAYLRTAGFEDVVDTLVGTAAPAFDIHRDDRAGGLRYVPANEKAIHAFLGRIERALAGTQDPGVARSEPDAAPVLTSPSVT